MLRPILAPLICSGCALLGLGQGNDPDVFIPATSIHIKAWVGGSPVAHTNHLIYIGPVRACNIGANPPHGPFVPPVPNGYSPDQIRAAYDMPSSGGTGKAIAIVDSFHYTTSLSDFNVFASQYGLPQETSTTATSSSNKVFQVVYQGSSKPSADAGWAQEEALDIEWAHALAPNAKIYLVEANSTNLTDLLAAVDKASNLPNVKAVSMSWGVDEFNGQSQGDSHFLHARVAYFSAAGDVGGVQSWPPASQYVVATGGTSLVMSGTSFVSESAWSDGGGGPSAFDLRPAYQHRIYMLVGGRRGCPDISTDSDPHTGCAVYDSTPFSGMSGWLVFGGTSVSCPTIAGMYVTAGAPAISSYNELERIYGAYGGPGFRDIRSGSAGTFNATPGWDFVTGVGAPLGTSGF